LCDVIGGKKKKKNGPLWTGVKIKKRDKRIPRAEERKKGEPSKRIIATRGMKNGGETNLMCEKKKKQGRKKKGYE